MGRPEDFGADPTDEAEEPTDQQSKSKKGSFRIKTGKRLFRNSEEEVIGGVAAGIAAYFGIPDPIWVRLLFVLLALSGGFGVPIYLILWAVMPEAKTAGDRLAMRGEPINVSNIGRIIEEEFQHISDKVTEIGEELAGKKKAPKRKRKPSVTPLPAGSLL
ncbi:MAG: PspC domain-containing protein [Lewinella sp.]|nr:PspC domain-containing protein [Lewinella sp.]